MATVFLENNIKISGYILNGNDYVFRVEAKSWPVQLEYPEINGEVEVRVVGLAIGEVNHDAMKYYSREIIE